MKKVLFFTLFLMILGTAFTNAQVRIGGDSEPNAAAVLDLNANDDATPSANKGALALPRVNLTSATMQLNSTTPTNGMLIYNTGTTFPVGVYVWVTDKWLATNANVLKITQQPKSFSWSRLKEIDGDPNGPATATVANLTIAANGAGTLTYAWYEKQKNPNVTDRGTILSTTDSYTPPVTAWGMHTYYCVVSDGADEVVSHYADVAIGCGAKTVDGGWLSFMCYNLGANTSLDPFTYVSSGDKVDNDIKGYLFQWGRMADGHQLRASAMVQGPVYLPTQYQVPASGTSGTSTSLGIAVPQNYADYSGKFIASADAFEYQGDWRTPQWSLMWEPAKTENDPCPAGWRVPSQTEFAAILSSRTERIPAAAASANSWVWTICGYEIKPDNVRTTLFFPAAGRRNKYEINGNGSVGGYWSGASMSEQTYNMSFDSNVISTIRENQRYVAQSVRCVLGI